MADLRNYTAGEQPALTFGVARLSEGESIKNSLTPKKPMQDRAGWADVFPYYAGFSFDWATEHLKSIADAQTALVLDPWNGSGTTTLAAQAVGVRSVGVDLSPVANVVARVRRQRTRGTIVPEAPLRPGKAYSSTDTPDPLAAWLDTRAVERLRGWLSTFCAEGAECWDVGRLAVFLSVRQITSSFEGSNPTWVKIAATPDELLELSHVEIDHTVRTNFRFIRDRVNSIPAGSISSLLLQSDAAHLPLKSGSVTTVLTSPPYLTRIDYAIAYRRELAVLGIDTRTSRKLRAGLMGTTTIRPEKAVPGIHPTTANLLRQIGQHSSKASSGYYLKQAQQYFTDLVEALREITRVCSVGASMTLVVQDSYYKDVLVQLADICVAQTELLGWDVEGHQRDPVKRSLTTLNTAARKYKKKTVTESTILLRKSARPPCGQKDAPS